tara:strand:+ start:2912 stop:3085 length:174 start_codon:yes stop_codon:yes gene_type:complete
MKVGDLVKMRGGLPALGIITCVDPEQIGDMEEVEVTWNDGDVGNYSVCYLKVVNESR